MAGEHEFTIPGLHTCPDSVLSPFNYPTELPWAQFIFRGEETVEGAKARHIKSFGMDQQYIYLENHHVLWAELQVWICYPMRESSEVGVFAVAPCFDGSRHCTRVITVGERERAGSSWTHFEKAGREVSG